MAFEKKPCIATEDHAVLPDFQAEAQSLLRRSPNLAALCLTMMFADGRIERVVTSRPTSTALTVVK